MGMKKLARAYYEKSLKDNNPPLPKEDYYLVFSDADLKSINRGVRMYKELMEAPSEEISNVR